MSVENSQIIDIISIDLNGNAVLTISDHLRWDINLEHLLALQDKINYYLNAIESGELYKVYPEIRNRKIIINIAAKYTPDDNATHFLKKTKQILESVGYGFACSAMQD
jgi:uncharacterized protein DUF6572